MKTFIKVTDQEKFDQTVADVDLEGVESNVSHRSFVARGSVEIEEIDGSRRNFSGEHGRIDYEDEYGFVLIHLGEKLVEEAKEAAEEAFEHGKSTPELLEEEYPGSFYDNDKSYLEKEIGCEIIDQDMEEYYIPAWERRMSKLIELLKVS